MELKTCFKCATPKPRSDFYAHPQMADGLLGKCKDCARSGIAANRRDPAKGARIRAYDRGRGNRQPAEYRKAYTNSDRGREAQKRYRVKYPDKAVARNTLGNAVRDGKVAKPSTCQQCGVGGRIHGHHHDYSRPLDVQWLCQACHGKAHRKYELSA
jgi:hypothetical protein